MAIRVPSGEGQNLGDPPGSTHCPLEINHVTSHSDSGGSTQSPPSLRPLLHFMPKLQDSPVYMEMMPRLSLPAMHGKAALPGLPYADPILRHTEGRCRVA